MKFFGFIYGKYLQLGFLKCPLTRFAVDSPFSMSIRTEILGNSLVLIIVAGTVWCQSHGRGGGWLEKAEPAELPQSPNCG